MSFRHAQERWDHLKHEETEELKQLITLLLKDSLKWKETALKQTTPPSSLIAQLQQKNNQMQRQITQLKEENAHLRLQLLSQQHTHSSPPQHNPYPLTKHSQETQTILPSVPSPKSPIQKLLSLPQTDFQSQQLCKLNSYFIEHNSNLKLLIEKYNYLLKLRTLSRPNEQEQLRLIDQTTRTLQKHQPIQQAQQLLNTPPKQYLESDHSSDIEEEDNRLYPD